MTPRGTDWWLALLVAALVVSGVATWFAGTPGAAWVVAVHDGVGIGLLAVAAIKLRRVARRLRAGAGAAALAVVALVLATGFAWAAGLDLGVLGYNGLAWHAALGGALGAVVAGHMVVRARRPRARDITGRRQLLVTGAVAIGAVVLRGLQGPVTDALGLRGARRRYTGSYETASYTPNGWPATSWIADDPDPLPPGHRVRLGGRPVDLGGATTVTALLDCTGGFYTVQRWRGTPLLDVLGPARSSHVSVVSVTGYRWTFALADAGDLLLATHAEGVALDHAHGGPVRLVAPGRRGFQWVKWVDRLELRDGPDPGAVVSTVTSSI